MPLLVSTLTVKVELRGPFYFIGCRKQLEAIKIKCTFSSTPMLSTLSSSSFILEHPRTRARLKSWWWEFGFGRWVNSGRSPYITSTWSVADSRSKVPLQETKESSNASFTCDYIDTRVDGDKKLDLHRSDWNTQTMLLSIDRHFRVSEFYFGKAPDGKSIASRWARVFDGGPHLSRHWIRVLAPIRMGVDFEMRAWV